MFVLPTDQNAVMPVQMWKIFYCQLITKLHCNGSYKIQSKTNQITSHYNQPSPDGSLDAHLPLKCSHLEHQLQSFILEKRE